MASYDEDFVNRVAGNLTGEDAELVLLRLRDLTEREPIIISAYDFEACAKRISQNRLNESKKRL